jgi:4'-phosphopantetheinyl transferase
MPSRTYDIPDSLAVHVWKIDLKQPIRNAARRFQRWLSQEERHRSEQFIFYHLRQRYILVHGALRLILAGYTGTAPEGLTFRRKRFGKPFLSGQSAPVAFNLSHCEDLALVAVTAQRPVGIDVEKVRQLQYLDSIMNRFFSEQERNVVVSVPPRDQAKIFFALWTRREAVAKAKALNLAAAIACRGMPRFPLGGKSVIPNTIVDPVIERDSSKQWCIQDLDLGSGFRGAVCVEGQACKLVMRDFQ